MLEALMRHGTDRIQRASNREMENCDQGAYSLGLRVLSSRCMVGNV